MANRPKLIAGNWKMNGMRPEAKIFLDALSNLKPEARPGRQLITKYTSYFHTATIVP